MNDQTVLLAAGALLRSAALVLLVLVTVGQPLPAPHSARTVVVLTDRSASIGSAGLKRARTEVLGELEGMLPNEAVTELEFAGTVSPARRAALASTSGVPDRSAALRPLATDLEAALRVALLPAGRGLPDAVVVISDGYATQGDTKRALEGAAAAGVPVLWRTLAPDVGAPRIVAVHTPATAQPRQDVPIVVHLGGSARVPIKLSVSVRDSADPPASVDIATGRIDRATLQIRGAAVGTLLLDVTLAEAGTGRVLDAYPGVAAIEVRRPTGILYVADGPTPLANSLRAGGWSVEIVPSSTLDSLADGFGELSAIVLDDVPALAARASTWEALSAAVSSRATGLLVLGGPRSITAGGYHGSPLEAMLPIESRPAALGEAAAITFVVDKSGSMGATSVGVDRFQLAQRAVVETAASLSTRDSAGVIVFDIDAREIMALQGATEFRRALESPWPARPRGGTRLTPALELAIAQLERAPPSRRFLVLVTDGFVADADNASLRDRLVRGGIEMVALAVGPEADITTLERLVARGQGTVLRVAEAAELPTLMRSSLEMRRARVERGRIAVHERVPLSVPPHDGAAWPAVAAYAVTRPRARAVVHLESQRGDPLLASRQFGLGQVTVVTSGLGAWTPEWLRWSAWSSLAGGLVASIDRDRNLGAIQLHVQDLPSALQVHVESSTDGKWNAGLTGTLNARTPSGQAVDVLLQPSAPGRLSATLYAPEAGLYTLTGITSRGTQQMRHLRLPLREFGPLEPNPAIQVWRQEGLLLDWSVARLRDVLATRPPPVVIPTEALLLTLALFVLGVAAERSVPGRGYFGLGRR